MLKPFFPFYGSKWRDAKRYHAPRDGDFCEPKKRANGKSAKRKETKK